MPVDIRDHLMCWGLVFAVTVLLSMLLPHLLYHNPFALLMGINLCVGIEGTLNNLMGYCLN